MTAKCKILTSDIKKQVGNVHWMPVEIQHNGDANIEKYFQSTIRKNESKYVTASLRGRPLHGTVTDVPSGYTGVTMKEARKPFSEDEDRQLCASESFRSLQYWNLDRDPSAEDKFQQALLWVDIADTLHQPVGEVSNQSSRASQ